jgi:UDP-N-acetylmuramate--alanine ligase
MSETLLTRDVGGRRIHFVGIKGVGMTALAEILHARGAVVTGSDTAEVFFTDAILKKVGIAVHEGFDERNLTPEVSLVIYSAAYAPAEHPELRLAAARGIPRLVYPEALGQLSLLFDSSGISGVHGKTTTTALTGCILKEWELPVTVVATTEVPAFGNRTTWIGGDHYLVAETCEYRRHFLNFSPRRIILTSVEMDHQDYFKDRADIEDAFFSYALRLPSRGILIYCADNPGAQAVVQRVKTARSDLVYVPYGETADGPYRVTDIVFESGRTRFRLHGFQGDFSICLPGRHMVLNAAAAAALALDIRSDFHGGRPEALNAETITRLRTALERFSGTRRRSEIIGEAGGILFMDDYAHHPTAIRTTLEGIKTFHPGRRLVVDFMSHTYSRTGALLDDFAGSFGSADEVILHRIYASAREKNDGGVSGEILYNRTRQKHPLVSYFDDPAAAFPQLAARLKPGDLFITLGAGDNWKLGRDLFKHFQEKGART